MMKKTNFIKKICSETLNFHLRKIVNPVKQVKVKLVSKWKKRKSLNNIAGE